jgi:hypothetical protein
MRTTSKPFILGMRVVTDGSGVNREIHAPFYEPINKTLSYECRRSKDFAHCYPPATRHASIGARGCGSSDVTDREVKGPLYL